MALNLPNLSKVGPGSSTGLGIRTTGTGAPKALFTGGGPRIKAPPKPQVSLSDQFMLGDPYDPKQIGNLAQSGYNTDVSNAQKLAQMGQPTTQQITTDYAGRGSAENSVYQDLAQRIAGIQQATVAQGNQGSAALGVQNAAAAASGGHIAGAPAAPALPTGAAQAVLASQTAAGGNYQGALQAAALSSGAQANQRALDAGTVASTTANNATQHQLASLLAGIDSPAKRAAAMAGENQKVDAANIQTKFSVYKDLVNQQQFAQASGDKRAIAAADVALKQWTTQQSNATKVQLGLAANATKTKVAGINAAAKIATAKGKSGTGTIGGGTTQSASARASALKQAIKIATSTGGVKTTTQTPGQTTITMEPITSSGAINVLGQKLVVKKNAAEAATYAAPKGYKIVDKSAGAPKSGTATINKPGAYTKYNRAASYLKNLGWTQAEIKSALKQYQPKP